MVCKPAIAPYGFEQMPWIKVLNSNYSQGEGRRELFRGPHQSEFDRRMMAVQRTWVAREDLRQSK